MQGQVTSDRPQMILKAEAAQTLRAWPLETDRSLVFSSYVTVRPTIPPMMGVSGLFYRSRALSSGTVQYRHLQTPSPGGIFSCSPPTFLFLLSLCPPLLLPPHSPFPTHPLCVRRSLRPLLSLLHNSNSFPFHHFAACWRRGTFHSAQIWGRVWYLCDGFGCVLLNHEVIFQSFCF